ncbi:MAG: hypothetical protein U0401_22330 [Anaerolineae bacterium]
MKFSRICWGLLLGLLLAGLIGLVNTKANTPPANSTPIPAKGSTQPGPIQPHQAVLDWSKAGVAQLTIITPTASFSATQLPPKKSAPALSTRFKATGGDLSAANVYFIGVEDFESVFPQAGWTQLGSGQRFWGDVPCFPLETDFGGFWSGWPASKGINGVDPCSGNLYFENLNSWLIYGPFSLQNAEYADVQFFFRMVSEQNFDFLFWGASINGTSFDGFETSGTHLSGPFNNGYNEVIFDLIPQLNQPQVWVGFQFRSDGNFNFQGPFIDGINILIREKGTSRVFLPFISSSPPPITLLSIQNKTTGSVTFTVANTPQGNISCTVPAGQTQFCGQFTPNTYNATANAAACPPPKTKPKIFEAGPVTLPVVCTK